MKEKKLLYGLAIAISLLLAGSVGTVFAAVTGQCLECHTMHNSQGGAEMATLGGGGEANTALVRGNCMGCHTGTTDPLGDANEFPYVVSSSEAFNDNLCLAGGFFPGTPGSGNNDDNHHGITNTNVPAGFDAVETTWYTGTTNGLGCAGTNGCHGNETDLDDMAAISGGHHNPTGAYRILSVNGLDVVGYGAADYEELIIKTPSTTPETTVGSSQNVNHYSAGAGDVTISELCAKCHGDFHGTDDVGSSGAWTRHPTDVAIPTEWAIASTGITLDGNDYKNNPVGYDGATYNASGGRKATCLSCHRAHGTENADLLRWAYNFQSAGNSLEYGCLGCHDQQR